MIGGPWRREAAPARRAPSRRCSCSMPGRSGASRGPHPGRRPGAPGWRERSRLFLGAGMQCGQRRRGARGEHEGGVAGARTTGAPQWKRSQASASAPASESSRGVSASARVRSTAAAARHSGLGGRKAAPASTTRPGRPWPQHGAEAGLRVQHRICEAGGEQAHRIVARVKNSTLRGGRLAGLGLARRLLAGGEGRNHRLHQRIAPRGVLERGIAPGRRAPPGACPARRRSHGRPHPPAARRSASRSFRRG